MVGVKARIRDAFLMRCGGCFIANSVCLNHQEGLLIASLGKDGKCKLNAMGNMQPHHIQHFMKLKKAFNHVWSFPLQKNTLLH